MIQCKDGSRIISSAKAGQMSFIRTAQNIPVEWESFYYEARIIDGGDKFGIGIGFTSKLPEIGNGFPQEIDGNTVGLCLNGTNLGMGHGKGKKL